MCFSSIFLKIVAQMREGNWKERDLLGGGGEEGDDLCRTTSVPFAGNRNKNLDQRL